MKKEIRISTINDVAKKAALGAMLASSVAMFASNPIKTERTDNPPQTEVVSKDGAEALKVMTFPQQQNPAVPTVHNKALDEKFLKLAHNEEEKKAIEEFVNNIYKAYGTYLGSATIQQNIDLNMFKEFLDGNIDILKRFDEEAYNKIDRAAMQKVVEKGEPIKQWLNENYFKVYNQPFGQFDHSPDMGEINNALEDYIENDPYKLFNDGLATFRYNNKNFHDKLVQNNNMDVLTKNSNLIAYKVNTADYILFLNLLKNAGIYNSYKDLTILENYCAFINAVAPKAE